MSPLHKLFRESDRAWAEKTDDLPLARDSTFGTSLSSSHATHHATRKARVILIGPRPCEDAERIGQIKSEDERKEVMRRKEKIWEAGNDLAQEQAPSQGVTG